MYSHNSTNAIYLDVLDIIDTFPKIRTIVVQYIIRLVFNIVTILCVSLTRNKSLCPQIPAGLVKKKT